MNQAAADQCPRTVEFGHGAGHAQRFEQSRLEIIGHRLAPHVGILAVGQGAGRDRGENYGGVGGIFEFFAGFRLQRLGGGVIGHVVAPVEKQHAHFAAFPRRIAGFGMFEAAAHLEQMAQGNLGTRIAGALPARDRGGGIEPQLPVRHQHADHHGGDRLGHRPADEARILVIARGVAFQRQLAAMVDHQRAGFAEPVQREQFVRRAGKGLGRGAGILAHRGQSLIAQRGFFDRTRRAAGDEA